MEYIHLRKTIVNDDLIRDAFCLRFPGYLFCYQQAEFGIFNHSAPLDIASYLRYRFLPPNSTNRDTFYRNYPLDIITERH